MIGRNLLFQKLINILDILTNAARYEQILLLPSLHFTRYIYSAAIHFELISFQMTFNDIILSRFLLTQFRVISRILIDIFV